MVFGYANARQTVSVKKGDRFDIVLSTRNARDGRSDHWAASASIQGDAVDWVGKEEIGPGGQEEGPYRHYFHLVAKQQGSSKLTIGNHGREPYELTVRVE